MRANRKLLLGGTCVLAFSAMTCTAAAAQPSGQGNNAEFSVGPASDATCTHHSVQAAVEAWRADPLGRVGIIRIVPGVYAGQAVTILRQTFGGPSNALTIERLGRTECEGGSISLAPVELSGAGAPAASVVTVRNASTDAILVNLRDIDITHGDPVDFGGGLRLEGAMAVTLEDVTIAGNTAPSGGGVALRVLGISHPNLALRNTRLLVNHASSTGGAIDCAQAGSILAYGGSSFEDNDAQSGGAIHLGQSTTSSGCVLVAYPNVAGGDAVRFDGNRATNHGGAIYVAAESRVAVADPALSARLVFAGNQAAFGGAMSLLAAAVSVPGADFRNNSATVAGGAVYASGGTFDASRRPEGATGERHAHFVSNIAGTSSSNGEGGAVFIRDAGTAIIGAAYFDNNRANTGAAVLAASANTRVAIGSTYFVRNRGANLFRAVSGSRMELSGVTATNNFETSPTISLAGPATSLLVFESILWRGDELPVVAADSGGSPLARFDCVLASGIPALVDDSRSFTAGAELYSALLGADFLFFPGPHSYAIDYCDGVTGIGVEVMADDYFGVSRALDMASQDDFYGPRDLGAAASDILFFHDFDPPLPN